MQNHEVGKFGQKKIEISGKKGAKKGVNIKHKD